MYDIKEVEPTCCTVSIANVVKFQELLVPRIKKNPKFITTTEEKPGENHSDVY